MDIHNDELLSLIACLEKSGVKYLIVGGFAVNKYGFKRATGDIDFFLKDDADNRKRLIDALDEAGYGRFNELMTAHMIPGYCEIILSNGLYADLMTEAAGLSQEYFDEYYNQASLETVGSTKLHFIHYAGLIQSKKATGRNKDLFDIEELEKINRSKK